MQWFLGLVAGLWLGALSESVAVTIFSALLGAVLSHLIFKKKAPAPSDSKPDTESDPELNAASNVATHSMSMQKLQRRIAELELRVNALEALLDRDSAEWADTPPSAPSIHSAQPEIVAQRPPPTWTTQAPTEALPQVSTPALSTSVSKPEPRSQVLTAAATHTKTVTTPPAATEPVITPPVKPAPVQAPPPPPPPPIPLRDRLPAPIARLIFDGNTLVKLGVLILFLGLSFFLRYAAERVTVPIELRYVAVALMGATLLTLGWLLRNKRAGYALILQGAGIGVFYLTTLAAMKLSGLLPASVGFAFLFGVAVLSAALAVLQNAPALALVAALEGFAAPVLASSGENRPLALFSYLLVLNIGIVLMAWFRAWRPLNLIGFFGTFTLSSGWAYRYYTNDQFGITQPFLIVFFLLFTGVGLLFARRTLFDAPDQEQLPLAARATETLRRAGRVDSALVFGVPMVAFGLQYLLMRPWEYGAAFSAMALAACYLLLGRWVFATQPRGLSLLAEAYAIVGVIFATLAIPLGLEGQWTGAAWAVEAAGMYWLGCRQNRLYARAFSFLVLAAAVWKLLGATHVDAAIGHPLLQGSVIGPVLVALSSFVMWAIHRRAKLDQGDGVEAVAGNALPWLGMGALTLLVWQWWTPPWAAVATATMASMAFGIAQRFSLKPLQGVSYGMQALALGSFIATLHRNFGPRFLDSGWGSITAGLIALNLLGCAAWSMRQAHRAALARGIQPEWSILSVVGVLAGVGLLHLAMLFQISLAQAALLWPISATVVLWVGLRIAHRPLTILAAVLQGTSALLYLMTRSFFYSGSTVEPAFGNLYFWTPVVLGLAALLAGDWMRDEAQWSHPSDASDNNAQNHAAKPKTRWRNIWCAHPTVLWTPVVWGLAWFLFGLVNTSAGVLNRHALSDYLPAALLAIGLGTSSLSTLVAGRRNWRQLGQATLATLPGLALIAALAISITAASKLGQVYVPSRALGWIAWPLALLWHLRLLQLQKRWFAAPRLAPLHVAGCWLFLLLAARECQWLLGEVGDEWSSWSLLGWVLAPALLLWLLHSRVLLQRWPLTEYRTSYLEHAATPVAAYLLLWAWVTNLVSAGNADPLPYLPLLNPLELAHWMVLLAMLLWWRALPASAWVRVNPQIVNAVVGLSGLAFITGMVLRSCHHYASIEWRFDALYASWLAQAALSITWACCGVATMLLGHGRRLRPLWLAGAALLGVVVVKLFFVELADSGGLFRIVSFMAVGTLLLLVGYFAPVPPKQKEVKKDVNNEEKKTQDDPTP